MTEATDYVHDTYRLTTKDNPFHPVDEFDEWWNFDHEHGYCCCEQLDRIAPHSVNLSEGEDDGLVSLAIDDFIRLSKAIGLDIYKKVKVN